MEAFAIEQKVFTHAPGERLNFLQLMRGVCCVSIIVAHCVAYGTFPLTVEVRGITFWLKQYLPPYTAR